MAHTLADELPRVLAAHRRRYRRFRASTFAHFAIFAMAHAHAPRGAHCGALFQHLNR